MVHNSNRAPMTHTTQVCHHPNNSLCMDMATPVPRGRLLSTVAQPILLRQGGLRSSGTNRSGINRSPSSSSRLSTADSNKVSVPSPVEQKRLIVKATAILDRNPIRNTATTRQELLSSSSIPGGLTEADNDPGSAYTLVELCR
jgi:hypothetical protein